MTCEVKTPFVFTQDNWKTVETILSQYPADRSQSALLPLLDLAQRQCGGWLPPEALEGVADVLSMAPLKVREVASFYTLFHLSPVGRVHLQICRTTPCWLRGSEDLLEYCRTRLGIEKGQTTPDGQFTLSEVECLGACVGAPVIQINDDFYENLTPESLEKVLMSFSAPSSPSSSLGESFPEGGTFHAV